MGRLVVEGLTVGRLEEGRLVLANVVGEGDGRIVEGNVVVGGADGGLEVIGRWVGGIVGRFDGFEVASGDLV